MRRDISQCLWAHKRTRSKTENWSGSLLGDKMPTASGQNCTGGQFVPMEAWSMRIVHSAEFQATRVRELYHFAAPFI
jgi:hypothetical protein